MIVTPRAGCVVLCHSASGTPFAADLGGALVATKTVVILPDFQIPDHDVKLVAKMVDFVADFQPNVLAHTGDLVDFKELGRWVRGLPEEYRVGATDETLTQAREILGQFREAHRGKFYYKLGNHDLRLEAYLSKFAPAAFGLDALDFEEPKVLNLRKLKIEAKREPYEIAPGWINVHGHEKPGLSQIGGQTAATRMRQYETSVVMGHTHRLGLVGESRGWGGEVVPRWGMEVGHAMDLRKASYIEDSSANWQQGFGVLRIVGQRVYPELVTVAGGRFLVDGQLY